MAVGVVVWDKFADWDETPESTPMPDDVFVNAEDTVAVPARTPTPTDKAEDVPLKSAPVTSIPDPTLVCSREDDSVAESVKTATADAVSEKLAD